MITPQAAAQIRAGLAAYAIVHTFRGYPTYNKARRLHRTKLGVLGTVAFDRAETKAHKQWAAEKNAKIQDLITGLRFQEIINHSYARQENDS